MIPVASFSGHIPHFGGVSFIASSHFEDAITEANLEELLMALKQAFSSEQGAALSVQQDPGGLSVYRIKRYGGRDVEELLVRIYPDGVPRQGKPRALRIQKVSPNWKERVFIGGDEKVTRALVYGSSYPLRQGDELVFQDRDNPTDEVLVVL